MKKSTRKTLLGQYNAAGELVHVVCRGHLILTRLQLVVDRGTLSDGDAGPPSRLGWAKPLLARPPYRP